MKTLLSVVLAVVLVGCGSDDCPELPWGSTGTVTASIGTSSEFIAASALQSDCKVVFAGGATTARGFQTAIFRFNHNGTLDSDFADTGRATRDLSSGLSQGWQDVAVHEDGKIVAGGWGSTGTADKSQPAIIRYHANGTADTTFADSGLFTQTFGEGAAGVGATNTIALQPDGKILAGGYQKVVATDRWSLFRLNADGTMDTTFGTNGLVTETLGTAASGIEAIQVQSDGKIVVSGYYTDTSIEYAVIIRYNADGSRDTSFSGDGLVSFPGGTVGSGTTSLVIHEDGSILAGGYFATSGGSAFSCQVYKVGADGTPAAGFGTDGVVTFNVGASGDVDIVRDLVVQPDGKVVVVGDANPTGADPAKNFIARLNADGTLDTSFGGTGKVSTAFTSAGASTYSTLLFIPGGRLLAVGRDQSTGSTVLGAARYKSDGSLDAQ